MGRIHYWIDSAYGLDENNGIQRVCRYLARGLEEQGQQLVYRRWSDRRSQPTFITRRQLRTFTRWEGPRLTDAPRGPTYWLDLTHAPQPGDWLLVPDTTYGRTTHSGGHETRPHDLSAALVDYARIRSMKIAFIFHDLLPIQMPNDPLRELHIERTTAFAKADLILPVSHYAAETLTRYFRDTLGIVPASLPRIVACPLPEEYVGWPRVTNARPLPASPVEILCVSTISPRKNQLRLLEAFDAFCRAWPDIDVHLTLAGRYYPPCSDAVERLARANPRVTFAGFLLDAEVIAAYDRAHFSAFSSIAEGYGLPIAESLWLGKPCLCANFGSMAEIAAGGGCLAVNTARVDEIQQGLASLILDTALRDRLAEEARTRPMRTWCEYARSVLATLSA